MSALPSRAHQGLGDLDGSRNQSPEVQSPGLPSLRLSLKTAGSLTPTSSPRTVDSTGKLQQGRAKLFIVTPLVVAGWFVTNIGLLLMNRALLSTYNFRHPVSLTMIHMLVCVALSSLVQLHPHLPRQSLQSKKQGAKVAALAAVFAVSVVGGNLSLQYIPVSFNQVRACLARALGTLPVIQQLAKLHVTNLPVQGHALLAAPAHLRPVAQLPSSCALPCTWICCVYAADTAALVVGAASCPGQSGIAAHFPHLV